jgi:diguanylate cyclase (GGDEF)-like protein
MAKTDILILPGVALIVMAAQRAVQRLPEQLYEPIVVELEPQVYRLLDVHQVLLSLSQIHQQATWYISELYYNLAVTKSKLEAANSELYRLANSDGLTKVANRRRFNEYLDIEWQKLEQEEAELSLILCDIDFFKKYNDTYGHQAGDACLQKVATAIVESVNSSTNDVSGEKLVARYGGEEFTIILPRTTPETAVDIAEQIRVGVKNLEIEHIQSPVGCVTLSLGVASTFPKSSTSKEKLISAADGALYQAKDQGRDRVILDLGF